MAELSGVLCVNKPAGMTSHDVVGRVRRLYGTKQVGHTGTLDPMATGVLVVLVGRAVKASSFLSVHHKTYRVGLTLGLTTDTQDTTGRTLSAFQGPLPDRAALETVIPQFIGDILQTPPMYSALKIGGRKLVDLARQNIEIERPARPVRIEAINVLSSEAAGVYTLEVACGPGVYMRTLCADIGAALGCGGAMHALTRLCVGDFGLEEAFTLQALEQMSEPERAAALWPVERMFEDFPAVLLPPFFERLARSGQEIYLHKIGVELDEGVRVRLCGQRGFFALGEVRGFEQGRAIKPLKLFDLSGLSGKS